MNRPMQSTGHAFRPLALACTLLVLSLGAPLAIAQDAGGRIEQQMTPEQFTAAGLDQLSTEQLDVLNAWLNRTLDAETSRAAEQGAMQAREEVAKEDRSMSGPASDEPVVARLQGRFDGFARGRRYTLDNGQVWRQTDNASLASVQLDNPQVTIDKALFGSSWYLRVEGYNTRAKVERVE